MVERRGDGERRTGRGGRERGKTRIRKGLEREEGKRTKREWTVERGAERREEEGDMHKRKGGMEEGEMWKVSDGRVERKEGGERGRDG